MSKTKFMEVMFSAVDNGNEALTEQVANDIEDAKRNGEVDTDEVTYINLGSGKVMVIDNVNQEATIVEGSGDEYEMEAMPDHELDKFLHTLDGTKVDDNIHDRQTVQEREFSVRTNNTAVLRFFSDQEYYEKVVNDVVDSEETAVVGNIQVDKVGDDEVVITDRKTGDQAKVTLDGDEMEVEELEEKHLSREFSESFEEFEPMFIVGIDKASNTLIDAPVYSEEDAENMKDYLESLGAEGVRVFEDPDDARDYAHTLMSVSDTIEAEEPEQAEFSNRELYFTKLYSERDLEEVNGYMARLYSEAEEGISDSQDDIEDAIESGEQVETDDVVITPIDDKTAVVEDKDNSEYTKVTLEEGSLDTESLTERQADKLMKDIEVESDDDDDDDEEEEKEFSEYYTRVMHKLFSEENDELPVTQAKIEDAIKSGEQIEDGDILITPVDDETAVIEDKKNDEHTKVTLDGEDLDTEAITEEEADELLEDIDVDHDTAVDEDEEDDDDDDEEEDGDDDDEEREFSYYALDPLARFFADATQGEEDDDEMVTVQVPVSALAQAQSSGDPSATVPVQAAGEPQQGGVEEIEDKAIAAVNSIQEAAQEAVEQIQQAKQAPIPGQESDIREAKFSERYYTALDPDPLRGWLGQF